MLVREQELPKEVIINEELITTYFQSRKKVCSARDIIHDLGINQSNACKEIETLLFNLEKKGVLLQRRNGYVPFPINSTMRVGVVSLPRVGKGYVNYDGQSIVIDERSLNGVLNGDLVLADIVSETKAGKPSGIIRKIIERSPNQTPFIWKNGKLIPYGFSFTANINVPPKFSASLHDGDVVAVNLSESMHNNEFTVYCLNLLGSKTQADIDYDIIATKYGYRTKYSDAINKELLEIPTEVSHQDLVGRTDLRSEMIFSIDTHKAQDFDDALGIKKLENGNYLVGIHKSDLAHYIKRGSAIDEHARANCFTLYFGKKAFHQYPTEISQGICSLKPHVDRLTFSTFIEYTPEGKMVDYYFDYCVINSKKQMTFEDVNRIIEDKIIDPEFEPFLSKIHMLYDNAMNLDRLKEQRGCIEFADTDTECNLDRLGNIIGFSAPQERAAEKIIKNHMLASGMVMADHLSWLNLPFPKRVHEAPDDQKIKAIVNFINQLGYKTRHIRNTQDPKSVQKIILELQKTDAYPILSDLLLKSMKRAQYSIDNIGHYALAQGIYVPDTAGIRRYIDVEIQYLFKEYHDYSFDLTQENLKEMEDRLRDLTKHASVQELNNFYAEKEATQMDMAAVMEHNVGKYYNGRIIDITPEGVIIRTTDCIVGRARFDNIKCGNYKYDPETRSLYCKKTNQTIMITDPVRIRVTGASKEQRTIDFSLIEKVKLDRQYKKQMLPKVAN